MRARIFHILAVLPFLVTLGSTTIGTFWHFTDFHLDLDNEIANSSGLWGSYDKDTSPIVAFTGIELGNDLGYAENRPDFVVWGGDSSPHEGNTKEKLLASLEFLSHHLKMAFGDYNTRLIPLIGNYDVYPVNEMSPNQDDSSREDWCTMLSTEDTLWHHWLDEREEYALPEKLQANFSKNCFHAEIVYSSPITVVFGLNSLVWYSNNPKVDDTITDPLNQFQWLNNSLQYLRRIEGKAFIATHIPPGAVDFAAQGKRHMKSGYNEQFVQLLREYSDIIIATLASHEHIDTFRVVLDEKYKPIGTIFLAPAVDPLHLEGIGSNNPRIRKYVYDPTAGSILDYFQYYLDLSQPGPSWELEYQASKEYGMETLSARSFANLLDGFTIHDNMNHTWDKYWLHQLGGRLHDIDNAHDCSHAQTVCRCEQICTVRHMDESELRKCLKICSSSDHPQIETIEQLENPKESPVPSDTGRIVGIVIGVLLALGLVAVIIYLVYRKRRQR